MDAASLAQVRLADVDAMCDESRYSTLVNVLCNTVAVHRMHHRLCQAQEQGKA